MIARAAVKFFDKRRNKEIIIPCHRHCDAFQIMKIFEYCNDDYKEIEQGFLDHNDNFMTRAEAWQEARRCYQFLDAYIEKYCSNPNPPTILYSEDLW